jgi:hypothetical protein
MIPSKKSIILMKNTSFPSILAAPSYSLIFCFSFFVINGPARYLHRM